MMRCDVTSQNQNKTAFWRALRLHVSCFLRLFFGVSLILTSDLGYGIEDRIFTTQKNDQDPWRVIGNYSLLQQWQPMYFQKFKSFESSMKRREFDLKLQHRLKPSTIFYVKYRQLVEEHSEVDAYNGALNIDKTTSYRSRGMRDPEFGLVNDIASLGTLARVEGEAVLSPKLASARDATLDNDGSGGRGANKVAGILRVGFEDETANRPSFALETGIEYTDRSSIKTDENEITGKSSDSIAPLLDTRLSVLTRVPVADGISLRGNFVWYFYDQVYTKRASGAEMRVSTGPIAYQVFGASVAITEKMLVGFDYLVQNNVVGSNVEVDGINFDFNVKSRGANFEFSLIL